MFTIAITIFLTITVTIGVLTFTQVDSIDHYRQLVKFMLVPKNINVAESGFRGHVRTADINTHVGHTAYYGRISYHTDRGCIQQHVVITGFQLLYRLLQGITGYQFRRVRGNRSS